MTHVTRARSSLLQRLWYQGRSLSLTPMNLVLQFATCTQDGSKGIVRYFSCRGLLRRIYHLCYIPTLRVEDSRLVG